MRGPVFAAVTLVVVVGVALGSGMTRPVTLPPAAETYPRPCTTWVPTPGPGNHLVLVFGSNTTAVICVRYMNTLGNDVKSQIYSEVYRLNATSPLTFSMVPQSELTSTPTPDIFDFTSGGTNQSQLVEFTLTRSPSISSGVYAVFVDQICGGIPLVIGTLSRGTMIAGTDFYPPGTWIGCPAILMQAQITGVSGLQVLALPG